MLGYHSEKLYFGRLYIHCINRVRGRSLSGIPIPRPIWNDRLRLVKVRSSCLALFGPLLFVYRVTSGRVLLLEREAFTGLVVHFDLNDHVGIT
jgi:hypothetical protein